MIRLRKLHLDVDRPGRYGKRVLRRWQRRLMKRDTRGRVREEITLPQDIEAEIEAQFDEASYTYLESLYERGYNRPSMEELCEPIAGCNSDLVREFGYSDLPSLFRRHPLL